MTTFILVEPFNSKTTFGRLRVGELFQYGSRVYIKVQIRYAIQIDDGPDNKIRIEEPQVVKRVVLNREDA